MKQLLACAALGAILVLGGCDSGAALGPNADEQSAIATKKPMGDQGGKYVELIDDVWYEDCDGDDEFETPFHVVGWFQERFLDGPKNQMVTVYHIEISYDGQVVWRDVGPDHITTDQDGNSVWSVTGRSTATYVNGHVVFNEAGEIIHSAGLEFLLCGMI